MSSPRGPIIPPPGSRDHETPEALELLVEGLPPVAVPPDLERRILASATFEGRFDRFVDAAADLLDLPRSEAKRFLDQLSLPEVWMGGLYPGMEVFPIQGGPKRKHAGVAFVRIKAGFVHPDHEHFGEEVTLVLQGSCLDQDKILRPGDIQVMPAETHHAFEVRPGPDFVALGILHGGLRMGEMELRLGE